MDLSDEELALQAPGVPNHALWRLGHVVHSCQAMAGELGVWRWLPDDWESLFGYGSSPAAVPASPRWCKPALLAALADASDRLRAALLATDDSRLAEALPDEKTREILPTEQNSGLKLNA